jgi:hypothetical protein
MGTYQGSFGHDHLDEYLAEFVFRWNRGNSPHRGLLFYRLMSLAAGADPLPYRDLIKTRKLSNKAPTSPAGDHRAPKSLAVPVASRLWRTPRPAPQGENVKR